MRASHPNLTLRSFRAKLVLRDARRPGLFVDDLLPLCVARSNYPFADVALIARSCSRTDAIFLWILISLTTRAKVLGRPYAWAEPIIELPWFGQWPGYPEGGQFPNGMYPPGQYGYPMMGVPSMGGYAGSQMAPGYVVQQNPGHSVVIQPGMNGQPPTITQVPGTVVSA